MIRLTQYGTGAELFLQPSIIAALTDMPCEQFADGQEEGSRCRVESLLPSGCWLVCESAREIMERIKRETVIVVNSFDTNGCKATMGTASRPTSEPGDATEGGAG